MTKIKLQNQKQIRTLDDIFNDPDFETIMKDVDREQELLTYFSQIFGKQFDNENWIEFDEVTRQVVINGIYGNRQEWDLTDNDLTRAIRDNQGETRKVLLKIRTLI